MTRTNKMFSIGIVFAIFLIFVFPQIGTIINYSNGNHEIEKYRISSGDLTPPELTELDFTPTTIDVSASSQIVTFTLRLIDELSGVSQASWLIASPSGTQTRGNWVNHEHRISGGELDGVYERTVEFPQYSEAGMWHVVHVEMRDNVGNWVAISEDDLIELGIETKILVVGGPDLASPNLEGFDFNPTMIDVSASSQIVTFTLRLTDELSGVSQASWLIASPSGTQTRGNWVNHWHRISGDELDGVYERTVEFPQYSEAGTWHVVHVELRDNVGIWVAISEDDLIELGFETTIEVISNPEDLAPPELTELDFTPTTIDVSASSQIVTFTLRLTDEFSGVSQASWLIASPSGTQTRGNWVNHWHRISGDELDGVYERTVEFPQYSETGTWHVVHVEIRDNVGNWKAISGDELINMGFLTEIEVVENQPPLAVAGLQQDASEGETVVFDASGSTDPDNDPLQFRWDFDSDGSWDTDWDSNPVSEYTWFDDYTGQVVVQVSDGTVEVTDDTTVTVNNVAPMVLIDQVMQPFPNFILPSDVIEFHGSFFDPGIYDSHFITWDFGDLNSASDTLIPTHAYAEAGEYTVTLTITDDDGGIGSTSFTIIVESPEEAAEEIIEDVEELDLPGVSEESLIIKLEVAQDSIEMGLTDVAIHQIEAFIHQVEAMRGKKLTNEEADLLISAAQWLIDNLVNNGT